MLMFFLVATNEANWVNAQHVLSTQGQQEEGGRRAERCCRQSLFDCAIAIVVVVVALVES